MPNQLIGMPIATRARSLDGWAFADWLPNPDPILKALGKDISVYRDLRADAHIGGCIRRRKAAVMGLEQDFDRGEAPARVAKEVERILAGLPLMAIIGELLDAALYGYQPAEITWARAGALLVPAAIVAKPPEWFHFDADNRLRFRSRDTGFAGELLPERKFILARQEPSYANPYGQPDLSMCFWPGAFKKGGLKFWVSFTERYGTPFLIGKLPRSSASAEYDDLADKLVAMVQDAIAVIPDDGSIEIMDASGKVGAEVYERLLMYCRSEIAIALLGGNQTTEADANRASATAGLEVARSIRDGDAAIIATAVQQLIAWIVEINWPGAAAPTWTLREQEEIDQDRPRRDKMLVDAGVKFSRTYWLETYGLKEEDLEPESAQPPQAQFAAAPARPDGQDLIDAEADSDPGWQAMMDAMLAPIFAALEKGMAPEDILGSMNEWYPQMDDAALIDLLDRAVAAAEAIGRLEAQR